jgi:phage/plasmid-like protein (TIGR03299 family)
MSQLAQEINANRGSKFAIDVPAEIQRDAGAILKHIQTDYRVEKRPLYVGGMGHAQTLVPNASAQVRSDTGKVLSLVSQNRYNLVQPLDYAQAALTSLKEVGLQIDRGWNLGGGRVVMFGAQLPEEYNMVVGNDDITVNYLYIGGGYNKKLASFGFVSGERLLCLNQLVASLARANRGGRLFSVPHQSVFSGKVLAAAMGLFGKELAVQSKVFNTLAGYKVTKDNVDQYFARVLGLEDKKLSTIAENKLTALRLAFESGPGANSPTANGTAYGLLNAVTHFVDHLAATKDTDGDGADKARAMSATFGNGRMIKQRALEQAMRLADVDDSVLLAA